MKRSKESGLAKKRKRIRMRFRALVRTALFNKSWLQDLEEQNVTTNIKKNISMLVRQQRKIGILTMADKALIRTTVSMRTIADRKKLVHLMLNLTCFSKFSPKIRARLATVIQFIYVTRGRQIIREGSQPLAVYFILSGEVEVSRKLYNAKNNEYYNRIEHISGPGESLGDVELLRGTPRLHSCKATNDVELLVIYEDQFNTILRPFMEKQWEEKKTALAAFDYFKHWDLLQEVHACKVGLLKQYEPLETIYHEDKGPLSYVHFVISGQCMILQCLKMKVTERWGRKTYHLVEIEKGDTTLFGDMTEEEIMKKMKETVAESRPTVEETESVHSSVSSEDGEQAEEEVAGVYKKARKSDYKRYALMCGVDLSTITEKKDEGVFVETINRLSVLSQEAGARPSTGSSRPDLIKKEMPPKIENHFIDVGSLTFGGIFGLGEELDHRVIMARTNVQCLLIPRFWLFEKPQNPGNIWQRTRFYLNTTIPSREILFRDFLATRKWQKFKGKLINDSLDNTKVGNPTKVQDIPIICRIVEANDDEDEKGGP